MNAIKEIIKRHKTYFIAGFLGLMAAVVVFFVAAGHYPIIMVNNQPVSDSRFLKNYRSAAIYYQNVVRTYNTTSSAAVTQLDLETAVLNQLVDATLIDQAVRKEVGSDFDYLVGNKIVKYAEGGNLEKAASALYGMGYEDFKNEVLVPQAERDVLAGRLFLHNQNFDDWIKSARKSASVSVFSKQFKWDGEKVVSN